MPSPGPSLIAVALLSAAPQTKPAPQAVELTSAEPSARDASYPVPVIDVVKVDDKLQIRVRSPKGEHKVAMETAYELDFASAQTDKASPRLATRQKVLLTVEAKGMERVERLTAAHKTSAGEQRLVSIGCDGVVTDGTSRWQLDGTSSFLLPGGTKLTLKPAPKGKARACGSVDIMHGDQRVHLTGRGATVRIGKVASDRWDVDHKTADGLVFLKVSATAAKIEDQAPSWLAVEHKQGVVSPAGVVFKAADGMTDTAGYKIHLSDVLVSSLVGEDG